MAVSTAMPNPFAATYTKEQVDTAEKYWQDVERHRPLGPATGTAVHPHRPLVREDQESDLDCGYYAVNTVLKNVGAGWSQEAQDEKNHAMRERLSLLQVANSGKDPHQCLHKACRIPGLSYLVQRSELSQYDHSQAETFFAIDSLVPALELRLGEARVRMLAANNNLAQHAVPLQRLWQTLAQNTGHDARALDSFKQTMEWVICGNGAHWKAYFRLDSQTFADLDSLHSSGPFQRLPLEELMQSVRAVAVIIPELPRAAAVAGGVEQAEGSAVGASEAALRAADAGAVVTPRPPGADYMRRVKAEYDRLVALAQEQGEVLSPETKRDLAQRAIAVVKGGAV